MGTKILIGNLPPETTEEEIMSVMSERGWPMLRVLNLHEDHPERRVYMVEVDMPKGDVNEILRRRGDVYFKERKLNIYVPVMMG